jgi:putative two-component system response regulator
MAVADVYDALASRRRYKEPMPHAEVVQTIAGEAGRHFDPQVVEVFLSCEQQFEQVFCELTDE